ncbi:hypothetical protein EAF04_007164 [Stromatinia cepivora]|nr:hypothetical protein EAF04_007164 [Stromatinia cepivora]
MFYKLARQDNPYHNDSSRDPNESHGKSVILLGRFSSPDSNNAIEVARLTFGINDENGVQVHLLSERSRRSLNWGRILLCEFTGHWFSVICGAADKPLEKKDLERLGRRFWNTMVSIQGKEEWMKNRVSDFSLFVWIIPANNISYTGNKSRRIRAWLAARTIKLNLRSEISKVSITGSAFDHYSRFRKQWLGENYAHRYIDDIHFDTSKDRKAYNELTLYHSLHGVDNQETRLSQSRSKFTKALSENGNSDIDKKRRVFLCKARSAINNAVFNAHAGDGYSSCLAAADTILLEYGNTREIWLEKCLLDIPTKALFRLAKIYFRPTETKTGGSAREAEKVLRELDKKRGEFLGEISPQTHQSPAGWRYEILVTILQELETQPQKRDALGKKWEELVYDYGTLERCLRTCEVLLPALRAGESAREIPRTSQTGSTARGSNHGNHYSSSMAVAPTRK